MAHQFPRNARPVPPGRPEPAIQRGIPADAASLVAQQQRSAVASHQYGHITNRNLSSAFDQVLPDVKLYRELQDGERRLDAVISRKRLDLQEMAAKSVKRTKVLRVFISNTASDQPWQSSLDATSFDFDTGADPMWNLRIEGRLVDDEPANSEKRPKFNSFFTSIVVELEPTEGADNNENNIIEWHEPVGTPRQTVEFDVLDIRRKGDRNRRAKISLAVKEFPDKFKLSPKLSEVLAIEEETKAGVIVALWQYIKFHKLQDEDEKRLVRCDASLKELFGRETVSFPQIMDLISPHLLRRQPIVIDYTIRVDKESTLGEVVFDIDLETDAPRSSQMTSLLQNWNDINPQVAQLDNKIALGVQALNDSRLQREFYKKFAENPADFIDQWTASQVRDLKILSSDQGFNEEDVRHSSFYTDDLLGQSVHLFLNARP